MTKIRTLIADDEPLAREGLTRCLAGIDDIEIVSVCADGLEAVDAILDDRLDLALLDIRMPGMGGFDVIDAVGAARMPAVIFVTAHEEFAIRAFDECAVDYVLKPIVEERVMRAVDRARRRLAGSAADASLALRMERLLERVAPERPPLRRFAVREEERVVFVPVDDVTWLEADRNYVRLHTAAGVHRIRATLAGLEERLGDDFVRLHRSSVARVDSIESLKPLGQGDYVAILDTGARLTTSRSYRENVRRLLDEGG